MRRFFLLTLLFLITLPAHADWRLRGAPQRLAGGDGVYLMRPLFAPDGARIAVTGPNYEGLWILQADGQNLQQITGERAAGFGYAWSASGAAIACRVARYDGPRRFNAVKIFDLAAGTERLLSDERTRMPGLPRWTDADQQVYLYTGDKVEFFDSGVTQVARAASAPQPLSFLQGGKIAIQSPGTATARLHDPLAGNRYINLEPSPGGQKLAFEVVGGNLFVMNIDGSGLVDLGRGHRPQWSPDGQYVVYMITEDDGHVYTGADIYVAPAGGGTPVQLTATKDRLEMNPAWAPDGRHIVYNTYSDGAIFLQEVEKVEAGD